MATFTTKTESTATISASADQIWTALSDPDQIAAMTPFLSEVRPQGSEHWVWELSKIPVLGKSFTFVFTERMSFDEPNRIEFTHDPAAGLGEEQAGVEGWYELTPADGGTFLATSLEISVDLPFPGLARPAVSAAMKGVVALMGQRFSHRLLEHLDARTL